MSDRRPTEPRLSSTSTDDRSEALDAMIRADRDTIDQVSTAHLFDAVARETVDREAGVRDRLRELATPARIGIAVVAAIGFGAGMVSVFGMRQDLDTLGFIWLSTVHLLVIAGSVLGLSLALRPTHRPPLNGLSWMAVGFILALPIALSLVPGIVPGMSGTVPSMAHLMCGSGGLLVALPVTVLVLLLDRSREPSAWRVMLAAGAAGLSAFGFGYWHCPSVDPTHLLVAHAGLGTGLGLVTLLVVRTVSFIRRRIGG